MIDSATATFSRVELIRLLADLLEPARRVRAIADLSLVLGIETFLVLVHDAELGKPLAAPGFPQTFPDYGSWHEFIKSTRARKHHAGSLPWPTATNYMPALGEAVGDRALLVLLGGRPQAEPVRELLNLMPLVTPGFVCERSVDSIAVQLQLARQVTRESSALASSLDEARRAAQQEIAARTLAESALRQARDELARTNEELERRVRERTDRLSETIAELEAFSYSISHDLRAPLRAIYGYADAVIEDAADRLEPTELEHVQRISRSAQRLDRLVQDVLRYSRVSRTEIALVPVAVEPVIRDVIAESPVLQALSDRITIVGPIPAVQAHEVLLTQCFSNLLLNAVKFIAPDLLPEIRIWSEVRGKIVRVWIQDNGIGIADEHIGRLFGMFQRIHPESLFEGTGIGLAIVRRAVTRFGGEVGVESTEGVGSRFWLDLQGAFPKRLIPDAVV